MPHLSITTDIEKNPWTDLFEETRTLGLIERIGRLPHGMESGKSSVAVVIKMPDGKRYMAETSMDLFQSAARALLAADSQ